MSTQEQVGTWPHVLRGNVRVTSPEPEPSSEATEQPSEMGWSVHDGEGRTVLSGLGSRGEAIRLMGGLALRGATLPLRVHRPDGTPTGEHLA